MNQSHPKVIIVSFRHMLDRECFLSHIPPHPPTDWSGCMSWVRGADSCPSRRFTEELLCFWLAHRDTRTDMGGAGIEKEWSEGISLQKKCFILFRCGGLCQWVCISVWGMCVYYQMCMCLMLLAECVTERGKMCVCFPWLKPEWDHQGLCCRWVSSYDSVSRWNSCFNKSIALIWYFTIIIIAHIHYTGDHQGMT